MADLMALARASKYRCEVLAVQCGVCERQLERIFLKRFHLTPKRWMQLQRLETARALLKQGYSTKAVATEPYYKGACQFCREFKKYFKRPPQYFAP